MSQVVINNTEPLSSRSGVLSDKNLNITPKRVHAWHPKVRKALETLPKGTGACDMTLGEPSEVRIFIDKKEKIDKFKKDMVLRELVVEFYRWLGNARSRVPEDSQFIVGRGYFYQHFLKTNITSLQQFLDDSRPLAFGSTAVLSTEDVLKMLNPDKILEESNKSVHDITYDDVNAALEMLKRDDQAEAERWAGLVSRLTDRVDISAWKDDTRPVRPDCLSKRKEMASHHFRQEAEKFSKKRESELERQHYQRLEKQGVVVPVAAFNQLCVVTGAITTILCIMICKCLY